eukprot:m.925951 g.925951  ORF g.925951 m.925951 type:complete len:89 (+) comp135424_c0_seq1:531-797(+)
MRKIVFSALRSAEVFRPLQCLKPRRVASLRLLAQLQTLEGKHIFRQPLNQSRPCESFLPRPRKFEKSADRSAWPSWKPVSVRSILTAP